MAGSDDYISVRDWRRKPPLPLTVPRRHHQAGWWWADCTNLQCRHHAAIASAPFIIRWGPDSWTDMLRRHGRCSRCGQRGLTLSHAGWRAGAGAFSSSPPRRRPARPRRSAA